jgi:hypothetical protein
VNLKKLLLLIAPLLACALTASANVYVYSFVLDGAGANGPTDSPGVAHGTLTIIDPDIITIDITYSSLSSDMTKVSFDLITSDAFMDFYAEDLPPSGHWTDTEEDFTSDVYIRSIVAGQARLQLGTVNYPYSLFGEIGGYVNPTPVPEPSTFSLAILGGILGFAYRASRKSSRGILNR